MTRTKAIAMAVQQALAAQHMTIDRADDADAIIIEVRLRHGHYRPRTVLVRVETILATPRDG